MITAQIVRSVREKLGMNELAFAKMLGVDARTVGRWEAGSASPTGAAEAVIAGLNEALDKNPSAMEEVVRLVVAAAAVGGLAYLLVKLFELATKGKTNEHRTSDDAR